MRAVTSDRPAGFLFWLGSSSLSPFAQQAGLRKPRKRIKNINDARGMPETLPIFIPLISTSQEFPYTLKNIYKIAKTVKSCSIVTKVCPLLTKISRIQENGHLPQTVQNCN